MMKLYRYYDKLLATEPSNVNALNGKANALKNLKRYDEILGSLNKRDRLQSEIKNLEMQIIKEKKERCNAYPKVIQSIQRLSNARIYENDIIKIDKIVSMTGIHLYKDKSGRFKQNLIDDLQKYGNLKSTIKNLQDNKRKKITLKSVKKTQPQRRQKKQKKEGTKHQLSKIQYKKKMIIKYFCCCFYKYYLTKINW